ncbi:MAG: hemolysin family protein [Planctomycetota bacterium]|nr:hemolysin family protein [Planctomycetota bacterium]
MMSSAGGEILGYLAAAGFLGIAAVGGACESALLSLSRARCQQMLEERGQKADGFLAAIFAGKPQALLAASVLEVIGLAGFLLYAGWHWLYPLASDRLSAISAAVIFLAILISVRTAAALIGEVAAEEITLSAWRALYLFHLPLRPFLDLLLYLTNFLARGWGYTLEKSAEARAAEMKETVSDGALAGVVATRQRDMLEGVFDLSAINAGDILTPRADIISIDVNATVAEAVALALAKGHSRLPIYEGMRDNIIGLFHVRDALRYWGQPPATAPSLRQILRKALYVPRTQPVAEVLEEMRRSRCHLAVVLDEYGAVAGLVTFEDILEEIIGDIRDEFDSMERTAEIQRVDKGAWLCDAQAPVRAVNRALRQTLLPEDGDYETLAGFVLFELGHIPKPGESFLYGSFRFLVESASERRVEKVRIRREIFGRASAPP